MPFTRLATHRRPPASRRTALRRDASSITRCDARVGCVRDARNVQTGPRGRGSPIRLAVSAGAAGRPYLAVRSLRPADRRHGRRAGRMMPRRSRWPMPVPCGVRRAARGHASRGRVRGPVCARCEECAARRRPGRLVSRFPAAACSGEGHRRVTTWPASPPTSRRRETCAAASGAATSLRRDGRRPGDGAGLVELTTPRPPADQLRLADRAGPAPRRNPRPCRRRGGAGNPTSG